MSANDSQGDGADQMYNSGAYDDPSPSAVGRHWMVDLAVTFKTWIGAIAVIGIVVLVGDFVQIPGWVWIYGQTALIAAVLGHVFGSRAVDALHTINHQYIIDLGTTDGEFEMYKIGPEKFSDITICGSTDMHTRRSVVGKLHFGYHVRELEEGEEDQYHPLHEHEMNDGEPVTAPKTGLFVNSPWHELLDPYEIERRQHRLDDAIRDLSMQASKATAMQAKFHTIVRKRTQNIVHTVINQIDGATMPGDDTVGEVVEKELNKSDSYGLDNAASGEQNEGYASSAPDSVDGDDRRGEER